MRVALLPTKRRARQRAEAPPASFTNFNKQTYRRQKRQKIHFGHMVALNAFL